MYCKTCRHFGWSILIYRPLGCLVWASVLHVFKCKHSTAKRSGLPMSQSCTHPLYKHHEAEFLLFLTMRICYFFCVPLIESVWVMHRTNCRSRVFSLQLSLLPFVSTPEVILILLCLEKRFSIVATYFYMKITFSTCWFSLCSLFCMAQGSQGSCNHWFFLGTRRQQKQTVNRNAML